MTFAQRCRGYLLSMGITLDQARQMLQTYLDAELKVLSGQSYSIGGRTLTRADLAAIRAGRDEWQKKVDSLENAKAPAIRLYGGVPRGR